MDKKLVLRKEDQEIFSFKANKDEGGLYIWLKMAPELGEVFRAASGDEEERFGTDRNGNNFTFYRKNPVHGQDILNNVVSGMSSENLAPSGATLSQRYNFDPTTLLLSPGQYNLQVLRCKDAFTEEGAKLYIKGATGVDSLIIWTKIVRAFLVEMWKEYMYPVQIEATLTTREIA